ncbi:unnamed protein product [Gongylonema pulchrum]|uniref:Secreted protein n=1 Tax=Gongylonema pulchrum TaxID=637853 RepID=A0A183DHP5_9BILA|nr:unnamed protein product [Gongylonema pulchrum]
MTEFAVAILICVCCALSTLQSISLSEFIQMTLAREISDEIVPHFIIELRNKGLDQREHTLEYTKTMVIAMANNLDLCAESTEKFKKYIEGMANAAEEATVLNKAPRRKRISSATVDASAATRHRSKPMNRKMQG